MERVLIIDDDRFTQNVLSRSLFKEYETRTADNGAIGIKVAESWHPDIILLDVEMPGKNGYEVCDIIKRTPCTQDIPVIFLSGNSSTRERMLGFEVGAEDYLTKPCEPDFLIKKIAKISSIHSQKKQWVHEAKTAQATALEAMSTSFELGKAIRLVENSYTLASFDDLARHLMASVNELGLQTSVMFKTHEGERFYSDNAPSLSPIEEDLLRMMHSEKRFIDFGNRTIINYTSVALLIKNMPLDDRPRYGRLKDTLPFLLGACDAKIRVLNAETAFRQQNEHLSRSILSIQSLLSHVSRAVSDSQLTVKNIMLNLTSELSLHLHKMGLEGDQEDYVLKQVDYATQALHTGTQNVESVEHALNTMIKLLQLLSAEQRRIVDENLTVNKTKIDDIQPDIELF